MSNDETVRNIEISMVQAEAYIQTADALRRLMDNRDFKQVILEGYFKEEAVRIVSLKAAHEMSKPDDQAFLIKSIDGIGCLQQYLNVINFAAQQAVRTIQASNESLEEIAEEERQEELDREAGAM